MERGRKPKPIELRDAEGNRGRRHLPAPVQTGKLDLDPPPVLGEDGRELWLELTERLGSVGALDAVDRVGLTALCIQWDRAMAASRVLEEQGHYAQGSMGQIVEHPALKVERKAQELLMRFCAEYAATPVARARIATERAKRDQQDEFEEIAGGDPVDIEVEVEAEEDALKGETDADEL